MIDSRGLQDIIYGDGFLSFIQLRSMTAEAIGWSNNLKRGIHVSPDEAGDNLYNFNFYTLEEYGE
jgi:hypothetical protein